MKNKNLITLIISLLACFPAVILYAQGDPGGDPDPAVPFDGGLALLIAAGIGYAAKKGYDKRKALKTNDK